MEAAVKALNMLKSAVVDNIPAKLGKAGGDSMTDVLTGLQPDLEDKRMVNQMD